MKDEQSTNTIVNIALMGIRRIFASFRQADASLSPRILRRGALFVSNFACILWISGLLASRAGAFLPGEVFISTILQIMETECINETTLNDAHKYVSEIWKYTCERKIIRTVRRGISFVRECVSWTRWWTWFVLEQWINCHNVFFVLWLHFTVKCSYLFLNLNF